MTVPSNVAIVGAGGHAKVVLATLRAAGGEAQGVYDDDPSRWGSTLLGVPVQGPIDSLKGASGPAIIAIGDNRRRKALAESLGLQWITVCHPAATIHSTVTFAQGCVVFAGAVIQPDARFGAHAIVNTGSTVDHDCDIGAFVHVAPGVSLAGGVQLGDGALLGVGAKVIPGISIGAWAIVGAGAVCLGDVPSGARAVGVPARVLEDDR